MTRARSAAAYVALVLIGITIGLGSIRLLPTGTRVATSEVIVDGEPTGVFRVSVADAPRLPWQSEVSVAYMDSSSSVRPSVSQTETFARAWEAACVAVVELGATSAASDAGCFDGSPPPEVPVPVETTGLSAEFPTALAYVQHMIDVVGDLTIVATGEVAVYGPPGAETTALGIVGSVDRKAAAAGELSADLLIVPWSNVADVATSPFATDTGEVLGEFDVASAVRDICERSEAPGCVSFTSSW